MPRLLFEDWTLDDFRSVLDSEDEVEELSKTVVQVAKVSRGQEALRGRGGSLWERRAPGRKGGLGWEGQGPHRGPGLSPIVWE